MAKQIGYNAKIYASARDVSGDMNTYTISRTAEAPEVTAFGDATRQRLPGGLKDWTVDQSGVFNTSASAVDDVFRSLLGGSTVLGLYPAGVATSALGWEGTPVHVDYSTDAPVDGVATVAATYSGSGRLYRGKCLYQGAVAGDAGSTNGASVDFASTVAASAGVYGVLRVLNATGLGASVVSVVIQESANDSSFSAKHTFANVTSACTYEFKIATGGSRYMRAQYGCGGTGAAASVLVFAAHYE